MQIADNPHPIAREGFDRLMHYREQLLAAGFHEPTKRTSRSWHWMFFKPLTSLTAFIVNLQGEDDRVDVVYGCASTAFTLMANDQGALITLGVSDDEITLRARLSIRNAHGEASAAEAIRRMHNQFSTVEKDELLAIAKEKRKAFIREIAVRLKPLGFRKKGNTWTRSRDGYDLTFNLQKSSYSDLYYFNVFLRREGMTQFGCCYDDRIAPDCEPAGYWRMDWQLIAPDDLTAFLDGRFLPRLKWLIDTPYADLGADPALWSHCNCQRTSCDSCWVRKNLWEARAE